MIDKCVTKVEFFCHLVVDNTKLLILSKITTLIC
jgi:hypothetical protein